jgi:hypothetical protein
MNYDHDHPELSPLPHCKSLGADPEAPAGRFRVLSRPTPAGPRPLLLAIRRVADEAERRTTASS